MEKINVIWLSIDPVRRKIDYYPKIISQKIEKSLMKPNLANANFKKEKKSNNNKIIKNKLKEYQKFIRKNYD